MAVIQKGEFLIDQLSRCKSTVSTMQPSEALHCKNFSSRDCQK